MFLATTLGLFAIILIFPPVNGAHFNPVVSRARQRRTCTGT